MNDFEKEYNKKFDIPETKTVRLTDAEKFVIGLAQLCQETHTSTLNYYDAFGALKFINFKDGSAINILDAFKQTGLYNNLTYNKN